jgi:hypothetical protein
MEKEVISTMSIGWVILSSLLSGLIGVLVSTFFYHRYERRKIKFDTAKRLFGYRYSLKGDGFSNAMNEVFIVFADAPKVIKAMEDLYNTLQSPNKSLAEDKLITFLKEICKDLNIDYSTVNESFFIKTFNVKD